MAPVQPNSIARGDSDATPDLLSAFVVLAHMAIKSYDLVIALTSGGLVVPRSCRRPLCTPTPLLETRWAGLRLLSSC